MRTSEPHGRAASWPDNALPLRGISSCAAPALGNPDHSRVSSRR